LEYIHRYVFVLAKANFGSEATVDLLMRAVRKAEEEDEDNNNSKDVSKDSKDPKDPKDRKKWY